MPTTLTAANKEPKLGTVVRDSMGRRWMRLDNGYGDSYWINLDNEGDDPESWTKVAGNYGPVRIVRERAATSVRLSPAGLREIDAIAEAEQRTRGDMIRLLLADGLKSYKRKRGMS